MALALTWPLASDGAGAVEYTSNDWRTLQTELFTEGVLGSDSFEVTERALGANMTLDITAGVAVLEGDDAANQGRYMVREDTATLSAVTIPTAHPSNPRIDLVGIQLRDPSEGGSAGRDSIFDVVQGTAASSPAAPTAPDSFLVLASVLVPAGAVAIEDADIADARVHATLAHDDVIADGSITVAKMAANSVDSDQYVDGSIDSAHLADAAVTNAKMAGPSSGTTGNVRYTRVGGIVGVATAEAGMSGAVTIPADWRPSQSMRVPAVVELSDGDTYPGWVTIASTGVITRTKVSSAPSGSVVNAWFTTAYAQA